MKYVYAFLILSLALFALTATAQNGPFSGATVGSNDGHGGAFPANLCTRFTSNTCIISEFCSPVVGSCTGPGPGGNVQDSGGLGAWDVFANLVSPSQQIKFQTNSSGTSQGYIVVIGTRGQEWSFSANGAGTPDLCVWSGDTFIITNSTFDGSRNYYRTVLLCD